MTKEGKRTLSSFGEVANDINIDNKNDNNKNDLVDRIIRGNKNKKETHTFKGYYLENRVADKIDELTDGEPRGTKSEFVNEIIKKYFQSEGIF